MNNYLVIYEQGETSWSAYLPDFPGCVAVGDSREEVEKSIRTALKMHIKGMKADGLPIPAPMNYGEQIEIALNEPETFGEAINQLMERRG